MPALGAAQPSATADDLYADRGNPASAERAAALWAADLAAHPERFESAWKLARALYWLGTQGPAAERRARLESGIEAGRQAARMAPDRPEGHFWAAANMGALAESFGLRAGLRYRGPIREALETVLRLDPGFQLGSADRALGRWYFRVPRLFGGSNRRAEEHLRRSLEYHPDSTISRVVLAELLVEEGRTEEARAELRKVLEAPLDPEWAPEDEVYKARARDLLERLR